MLLHLLSNAPRNRTIGAMVVPSPTIDKFCRNSRLYSGNDTDRGETAQYDNSAMLMVTNINLWMESKVSRVPAPAISISCISSHVATRQFWQVCIESTMESIEKAYFNSMINETNLQSHQQVDEIPRRLLTIPKVRQRWQYHV